MEVVVNGEAQVITSEITVAELIEQMDLAGKRLAVELNEQILPKGQHAGRRLEPGDRVEIIQAIGGG